MDWIGEGFEDFHNANGTFCINNFVYQEELLSCRSNSAKNVAALWLIYIMAYDGMLKCGLIMQPFTSTRSSNAQTDRKPDGDDR